VARLVWTPPATGDVARLHAFLAPKNRDAARRAVSAIRQGVKTLAAHPEIGRPASGLPAEFRDWFIAFGQSGYVVRYRFDGAEVAILAVRHGKEAGN
jgi:plasmid stabilization system protein ParE